MAATPAAFSREGRGENLRKDLHRGTEKLCEYKSVEQCLPRFFRGRWGRTGFVGKDGSDGQAFGRETREGRAEGKGLRRQRSVCKVLLVFTEGGEQAFR